MKKGFKITSAKNSIKYAHILLLTVLVILVISAVFIIKPNKKPTSPQVTKKQVTETEISITSNGFTPSKILVKKGTVVVWKNQDASYHQVASDPHPEHTSIPGLDSSVLGQNEIYGYTFDNTGTYTYHDHLNPLKFTGTVTVEE